MVKYLFIFFLFLFLFLYKASYSQTNYEAFKGKGVKTITPTRLVKPYFCQYKDSMYNPIRFIYQSGFNSASTPEDIIYSAYCGASVGLNTVPVYSGINPDTSNRNGIILIHKLTFFWQGVETAIVKFAEMKDSVLGKPSIVQLQHIGNGWQSSNINGIKNIENVILSIRTNFFWEFNNRKSEIALVSNSYPKVKNEEGILNIDLFSDFINQLRTNDANTYNIICDN